MKVCTKWPITKKKQKTLRLYLQPKKLICERENKDISLWYLGHTWAKLGGYQYFEF